jgi:hypothetical protein
MITRIYFHPTYERDALVRSKAIAASLAVLIGTCAGLLYWTNRDGASDSLGKATEAARRNDLASTGNEQASPPGVQVARTVGAPDLGFESSRDLRAFVDSLALQAAANDAEALWWTYRALDYCRAYARDPASFARDTEALSQGVPAAAASSLAAARGSVEAKCKGFSAAGVPDDGDVEGILRRAALAGSVAAEASVLKNDQTAFGNDEYVKDLVTRVQASRDPQAYLALSSVAGTAASTREDLFGGVAGTDYASFAWQIEACNLGLDCSSSGSLMIAYCANGGLCGNFNNLQDLVMNGLVPRAEADRVQRLVSQLRSKR